MAAGRGAAAAASFVREAPAATRVGGDRITWERAVIRARDWEVRVSGELHVACMGMVYRAVVERAGVGIPAVGVEVCVHARARCGLRLPPLRPLGGA